MDNIFKVFTLLNNMITFLSNYFHGNEKLKGHPWWSSGWKSTCQFRRHGFHSWSGKTPHTSEQLSLCATTTEPVLQSPGATPTEAWALRARAPQQETPLQREACTLPLKSSPQSPQLEKTPRSNEDPAQPEKKKPVGRGHGAMWATVHGVAKSRTLLRGFEREREVGTARVWLRKDKPRKG